METLDTLGDGSITVIGVMSDNLGVERPFPNVIRVRRLTSGRVRRFATREEVVHFAMTNGWTDFQDRPLAESAARGEGRLPRDLVSAFHRRTKDAVYPY